MTKLEPYELLMSSSQIIEALALYIDKHDLMPKGVSSRIASLTFGPGYGENDMSIRVKVDLNEATDD